MVSVVGEFNLFFYVLYLQHFIVIIGFLIACDLMNTVKALLGYLEGIDFGTLQDRQLLCPFYLQRMSRHLRCVNNEY